MHVSIMKKLTEMNDTYSPPYRIAIVVPSYEPVGGGERFASEITARLAENPKFEMHVLANHWVPNSERIRFHWLPVIRFPRVLRPLVFALLARLMTKRLGVDLIHTHHWIFEADIYSLHGTPHAYWRREVARKRPRLFDRAVMAVEKRAMRGGRRSHFLSVSSIAMNAFRQEYPNMPGQWQLMPPGVEVARFSSPDRKACRNEICNRYGIDADSLLLLFVGMNFELKGLGTVIEALATARATSPGMNICLLVVGRGNESKYRKIAEAQGVGDAVIFAGAQRVGMEHYYRAADIFLLLSAFDTFGMVVLEAMAAGLPVIVSPNVGAKDLVQDGVNGFVLPNHDDAGSAARHIVRLADESTRNVMGGAASQTAGQHDWDKLADAMEKLYLEILESKSCGQTLA